MVVYEVPLSPEAQTFRIALAGKTYALTLVWNTITQCWVLNIDTADNQPIVQGIPLVTGIDLLKQYQYLNFGGSLLAQTDGSSNRGVLVDGNSNNSVIPPGDWFIVGLSLLGEARLWGDSLNGGSGGQSRGPVMSANIFPNDVPTYANLGSAGRLFFVVE